MAKTGKCRFACLTLLFVALAFTSFACDDFRWHGSGGADGDVDFEAEWVADGFVECTENQLDCDGTWKTVCEGGVWKRLTDCSDFDKICRNGTCVRSDTDGDEVDGDIDADSLENADILENDSAEVDENDGYTESEPEFEELADEDLTEDGDATDIDTSDVIDMSEDEAEADAELEAEIESESELDAYPPLICNDGICVDPATGFEWQQTPTGGAMIWEDAVAHCENLDLEGNNWRLPNISELRTLVRGCADIETGGACGVVDECVMCDENIEQQCLLDSCCESSQCNPHTCPDIEEEASCYWLTQLDGTCFLYWSSSVLEDNPDYAWNVRFNYGQIYRDPKENNRDVRCVRTPTPDFVQITAGTFIMGSPDGVNCPPDVPGCNIADYPTELGRGNYETQHTVTLTYNFEMQIHETTQLEWLAAFGNNPGWFGPNGDGEDCGFDCPVERVNWYEALTYANWLSEQNGLEPCYVLTDCTGDDIGSGCLSNESSCTEGTYACTVTLNGVEKPQDCEGYRLPTEAEWEYAARAGSKTAYYNGQNSDSSHLTCETPFHLTNIAWYCGNAEGTTHPAVGKDANAFGLYDMSGNVWEWVWDWFGAYPATETDPTGAEATSSGHAYRGGGWNNHAKYARSAYRFHGDSGDRFNPLGFRLVRTLSSTSAFFCSRGVCTDPETGFEWQQEPTGGQITWENAVTHCNELDLDGGDWRLPNISELRSLVRNCADIETGGACGVVDVCEECGIETACLLLSSCWTNANCNPSSCTNDGGSTGCYWPSQLSGTCSWYWSSSSLANSDRDAWYVLFYDGYVYSNNNGYGGNARCVR